MLRRLLISLVVWSAAMALHATNGIAIHGAEGTVGSDVTLQVDFDVESTDVVAAEIHIPIPDGIATATCTKAADRFADHSLIADINGNEYVIALFSTSLKTLPVGKGTAFSITLSLGDNPGVFDLTPRVKLSDASGNLVACEVSGEKLTALGARLALDKTDIDFGRVPIRSTVYQTVTATNTGTIALSFDSISTGVPGLTVAPENMSVAPGESTTLLLTYAPTQRAAKINDRFTVHSNAVGRKPFVKVASVPFSVNELHIGSVEGISDTEVTVSVMMNNMEPIVGAEFTLTLPDAVDFVEGSVALNERASMQSVQTSFNAERKLRIILYNIGMKPVSGDDGELLTFRLRLTGSSGWYYLDLSRVILSNKDSENMTSATSSGGVMISSPYMSGDSELNVGNVPISGTSTFNYTFSNYGSVPLTVEKVSFLDDVAQCKATFPIVVQPYESGEILVTITNPELGQFGTTMNVYTNDPDNRMKQVAISGNFFTANEMYFSGKWVEDKYVVTATLANERPIVAMQLDVITPKGIALTESDLALLERASTHSATLAKVDENGRYRIIIFSLKNAAFTGNDGGIFTLTFDGEGIEGKQLKIENVKLSSADGKNYTTPDSDVKIENIPVLAKEIELSETTITEYKGEQVILTATVLPAAAPQEVIWASSDTTIATVNDGIIDLIKAGSATITATSLDGKASAKCEVTVIDDVPTGVDNIEVNEEITVYTLDGILTGNSLTNLQPGLYIVRRGLTTSKVLVK